MKHCTTCNFEYENQLLRFCRRDGTSLTAKPTGRSAATVFLPLATRVFGNNVQLQMNRSIAVLPFTNMTGDPQEDLFCDGLSLELINGLAQTDQFHVASPTSSFALKHKRLSVSSIGKVLRVVTILEGSVRKAGNRVRITAQLVDTDSGFSIWSERYDRELGDAFDIQDQISRAIVSILKPKPAFVPKVSLVH